MTIDHLPGNLLGRVTNPIFGPLGLFTAASAFFFLSGLASARAYGGTMAARGLEAATRRVLARIGTLYAVHVAIVALLFAGVAVGVLGGPQIGRDFALFVASPAEAVLRALVLDYRPGYTDILPMYLFFLLTTPLALLAIRGGHLGLVVVASVSAWLAAQTYPVRGTFNLLGYQLVFIAGLVLGASTEAADLRRWRWGAVAARAAALLAVVFLVLRIALAVAGLPTAAGASHWLTHMDNNGPLRVLSFAAVAYLFAYAWPAASDRLRGSVVVRWLEFLGRHSLPVFIWSIACTYLSMAALPLHASRVWRLSDLLVVTASLAVPALLHAAWSQWRRSRLAGEA